MWQPSAVDCGKERSHLQLRRSGFPRKRVARDPPPHKAARLQCTPGAASMPCFMVAKVRVKGPTRGAPGSPRRAARLKKPDHGRTALLWLALAICCVIIGAGVIALRDHLRREAELAARPPIQPVQWYDYEVITEYPHDPAAFTQGLLYHEEYLYESTGQYGESGLRKVDLKTGAVLERRDLPANLFGEGLAWHAARLYQLTWRAGVAMVYRLDGLDLVDRFVYPGEGWGLASDGERLYMSDGTDVIKVLDDKMRVLWRVQVRDENGPVRALNELEWYNGLLLANVWQTDLVAMIDPASGNVRGWIDLGGLLLRELRTPRTDVLNGIAHDAETDRLFVTGKYWPRLYEICLKRRPTIGR